MLVNTCKHFGSRCLSHFPCPSTSAESYPSLLTSSTTQLDSIDKVCGAVNGILNQDVSTNISLTNQELPSANLPRNHDPSWRVLVFNVVKGAVVQKIRRHPACWKLEVQLWQEFSSLSIVIYCDSLRTMDKLPWFIQVQTIYIQGVLSKLTTSYKQTISFTNHWNSCVSNRRVTCMTGGANCLIWNG